MRRGGPVRQALRSLVDLRGLVHAPLLEEVAHLVHHPGLLDAVLAVLEPDRFEKVTRRYSITSFYMY